MSRVRLLWILVIAAFTTAVHAYKEPTHEELSLQAVKISALGGLLEHLGLKSLDQEFKDSAGTERTIVELVQFGARLEDSGGRPTNHFFDPQYDRPLTVFGFSFTWEKSPDWILDGKDQPSGDEFSYRKAQEHFIQALSAPTNTDRERAWGLTFQNLGHVIHHIQDMAQPQHVRNDQHLDSSSLPPYQRPVAGLIQDPSYYEEYTALNSGKWQPLLGQAGAPVLWDRARYYWTGPSSDGMADFTNRNFVSKDTNFQIKDNEAAANPEYPLPQPGASSLLDIEDPMHGLQADPINRTPSGKALCDKFRNDPRVKPFPGSACYIEFIASDVRGLAQFPVGENTRAASLSIFDQYLRDLDKDIRVRSPPSAGGYTVVDRVPTLNRFNFDSGYPFLIPRAVNYSAGLINHFFRGRLEFISAEVEGDQVRIEIKNVSGGGNDFGPGTFTMYYESYDGTRKSLPISSGSELGSGQLLPQGTHTLVVEPPEDLNLTVVNPYVLVYQGVVGVEHAVTGLIFDAPSVYTGFIFTPSAPLSDGKSGTRLLYSKNGQWNLHPQTGFAAGTVDWKGRYKDGKPTRVLSWAGDRYSNSSFSQGIYQNGKLYAVAPYPVLGAALQQDANGNDWIIAICNGESKDIVFKRPARASTSPAIHNAQTSPDGWQRIGEFSNPPDLGPFRRAWLFNGAGTEAQTMRELSRIFNGIFINEPRPLARLKISINGSSASFENFGNTKVILIQDGQSGACPCIIRGECPDSLEESVVTVDGSENITGEHVIAVDYVDNREVLARIRVESTRGYSESGFAIFPDYRTMSDESRQTNWTLEFGSIRHELINETFTEHLVVEAVDEFYVNRTTEYSVDRTLVQLIDLRTDLLVSPRGHYVKSAQFIEEEHFVMVNGQNASEVLVQEATQESGYSQYYFDAGNSVREVTAQLGVFHRDANNEFKRGPEGVRHPQTYALHCAGDRPEPVALTHHYEAEVAATLEAISALQNRNPLPVPGAPFASAAASDQDDNLFISVRYGDSRTNTFHYFNFLTGGDPVTVTGINPLMPLFSSIRPN